MADVFEKLKSSFDKGVATVSIKSNEFVETTKIKTQIANLEKEFENHQRMLGKVIYKQWCEGVLGQESIEEICMDIQTKEKEIIELQNKLISMQEENKKILQSEEDSAKGVLCSCGQTNKQGAKFCMGCGAKLEYPLEDLEDKILCECGALVKKAAKFCPKCGNKMNPPESEIEEIIEVSEEAKEEIVEETAQAETVICSCGQELPVGAKFCGACGANL